MTDNLSGVDTVVFDGVHGHLRAEDTQEALTPNVPRNEEGRLA
jgi:hypothetical protein